MSNASRLVQIAMELQEIIREELLALSGNADVDAVLEEVMRRSRLGGEAYYRLGGPHKTRADFMVAEVLRISLHAAQRLLDCLVHEGRLVEEVQENFGRVRKRLLVGDADSLRLTQARLSAFDEDLDL